MTFFLPREHFLPLFDLDPAVRDSVMGRIVGEGLRLDDRSGEVPTDDALLPLRQESVRWLERLLRPEWRPVELTERLFAVRSATCGQDAFLAVWSHGLRALQAAVTRRRIHVCTPLPGGSSKTEVMRGLELAAELFPFLPPRLEECVVQPFGGVTLCYREPVAASGWESTMLLVTDGASAKYSFLKRPRGGACAAGGGELEPIPWFPSGAS